MFEDTKGVIKSGESKK